ncbi:class I SAM-dependent DNA methyltransferase [Nocardiopsis akebiae]|uniref:site-specific DNA-methyltransferase (adenine-specific) n=1 Tax=Nocardiopsis akebiae TaxID=2831968 RepID=A0ABX8CF34_9ACTN|nr:class I SAM-dependent DNA methyltransferase [Nocardiopsis akebiae]QUX31193.1 class I SAM-dependent DNA methyltransferase [Nocardiopsis akebiae]
MGYDSLVNRGEYFSAHYLAEVLPKHLKGKDGPFKEWAERESAENKLPREERSPWPVTPRQGLRQLKGRYFADRQALADFTERLREGDGTPGPAAVAAQTERLHALHRDVLTALGFTPKDAPAESLFEHGDQPVPVRLALHETTVAAVECGWAPDTDAAMDPDGAGWLLDPVDLGGRERITLGTKLVSWLFARDENLRYVLVLAGGVVVLADRSVWGEGRYLAVSLDTALGRGDNDELGTIAALFGAQALLPSEDGGAEAIATLVDASRQHAVGVSKELREGLQRSVEIIANEVLARLRDQGVDPERIDTRTNRTFADELARQSLRYLYRILFLLYAEARPELGVVPAKDEAYVRGYSMARLGDLVVNDLVGEEARGSTHLYQSLDLLFRMVNEGHNPRGHVLEQEEAEGLSEGDGLRFEPLRADLFDPERTRLIGTRLPHPDDDPDEPVMEPLDTRLRNEALHQVLRRLMISRGTRRGRGGFISYAQLGINQLGAVYEGLMSYTGFIAQEELYEAAKNGDPSGGSWMVPHSKVEDYSDDVWVRVKDENGKSTKESPMVVYKPGSFVYRLAGRDRETSASYYTPESLTQLTVQLTLRERLDQDGTTTPARELLEWTICEPALGSGAFLNEAINQVAAEYLKRAQAERGEELDPERYAVELQKVKAYIALHRAYGVDLNGTAVELAEVSLWLNVMYPGLQAPWFGLHLRRGNSLIGAGRRLYDPETVKKGEWLKSAPVDQPFRDGEISEGYIHHFLLPAQGWGSVAAEKEAKALAPEDTAKLGAWRRAMRRKPKTSGKNSQFRRLQALSRRAEFLWGLVIRRLELSEREISRRVDVYGADWIDQPEHAIPREEVLANLTEKGTPYWRLKTLMDAWCALWFWPVQKAGLLDGSDEVYQRLGNTLELSSAGGNDSLFGSARESLDLADLEKWLKFAEALLGSQDIPEGTLFSEIETLADLDAAEDSLAPLMAMKDEFRLGESFPWLHEVENLAERHGFFHWELKFAHLFKNQGGFDIQVGNPPWVRPIWDEDSVLAELDPWFKLVKVSAEVKKERKKALIDAFGPREFILSEKNSTEALGQFLSSEATYPLISGTQPDLYRAFMARAWAGMAQNGIVGLLHPDTHFYGDREGKIRRESYQRLRVHGDFVNPGHRFFPDPVGESTHFGVHIYGREGDVDFAHLCWLFSVKALVGSFEHDGSGDPPGVRYRGKLDERPHRMRVIRVTNSTLEGWRELSGAGDAPVGEVKLLNPVSTAEEEAIRVLADYKVRLGSLEPQISPGYHEKGAKNSGLIDYDLSSPRDWSEVVLKGIQIGLATSLFKSPTAGSNDVLGMNLVDLPVDAVPQTEYRRTASIDAFLDAQDRWLDHELLNERLSDSGQVDDARACIGYLLDIEEDSVTDIQIRENLAAKSMRRYAEFYRVAWREMVAPDTERSLYASIIPPGSTHVHAVHSAMMGNSRKTSLVAGFWSSVPVDYYLRVTGVGHFSVSNSRMAPVGNVGHPLEGALLLRTLRLNCLTDAYVELWEKLYEPSWRQEAWACAWPGLSPLGEVGPGWEYQTPLRDERSRRSALVEIDALVAVWLGMDVDALIAAYRARFPVLNRYEESTWFDANGWKLAGIHRTHGQIQTKQSYKQFLAYQDEGGPVPEGYSAPFYKADREREYREAHAHFTEIVERAKRDGTWDGEV